MLPLFGKELMNLLFNAMQVGLDRDSCQGVQRGVMADLQGLEPFLDIRACTANLDVGRAYCTDGIDKSTCVHVHFLLAWPASWVDQADCHCGPVPHTHAAVAGENFPSMSSDSPKR